MFFNFYISFRSLQVTAYGTGTNYLCLTSSYNTRKKVKKKSFENFENWHFQGNFSFFPSLSLYLPQVTPFDLQSSFLACRLKVAQIEQKKFFLKIFIFDHFRAIFDLFGAYSNYIEKIALKSSKMKIFKKKFFFALSKPL